MKRRSRAAEETVTLFPFLAVLLCTMGMLVVVFVLVAQKTTNDDAPPASAAAQSSENAANAANVANVANAANAEIDARYAAAIVRTQAASLDEIQAETESTSWFLDELQKVRERTQTALDAGRARLADAEKALANLRDEAEISRRKYETLQNDQIAAPGEDAFALQEKIDALDAEIQRLQTEAQTLREKNANAKRSYSIVPYQGKKGTFRRPIFVECNANGVFLQPENVRFDPSDFLLARYPGNPFDAALRAAARRQIERDGEKTANGDSLAPYPLLIVRPGGAEYFYPAVAALASWGDVYGYEFVADDEEIAYPPADSLLAREVVEQARFARERLAAQLAALLSARRAVASLAGANSKNAGEFGADGPAATPNSALQTQLGAQAKLGAGGAKIASVPNGGASSYSSFNGTAPAVPTGSPYSPFDASPGGAPSTPFSAELSSNGGAPLPRYSGQFAQFSKSVPNVQNGTPTSSEFSASTTFVPETSANNANTSTNPTGPIDPNGANDGLNGSSAAGDAPSSDSTSTPFLALFQTSPTDAATPQENAPHIDARQTLGNTTFAVGATGSSASGTLADSKTAAGSTSTRIVPVERQESENRDDDVAYSSSRREREAINLTDELRRPATAGLERGVVVRCAADKLVFPKQPGLRAETTVAIAPERPLDVAQTELLDAIVLCVKSWGVAGRNMYWAPFLKVEVEPNGEKRFDELSEFCRTQGLAFVRVKTADSSR